MGRRPCSSPHQLLLVSFLLILLPLCFSHSNEGSGIRRLMGAEISGHGHTADEVDSLQDNSAGAPSRIAIELMDYAPPGANKNPGTGGYIINPPPEPEARG